MDDIIVTDNTAAPCNIANIYFFVATDSMRDATRKGRVECKPDDMHTTYKPDDTLMMKLMSTQHDYQSR